MYLFTNIIGVFVFDEKFNVIDKILFDNIEEYNNKEKFIEKLKNKHKNTEEPNEEALKKYYCILKMVNFFKTSTIKT